MTLRVTRGVLVHWSVTARHTGPAHTQGGLLDNRNMPGPRHMARGIRCIRLRNYRQRCEHFGSCVLLQFHKGQSHNRWRRKHLSPSVYNVHIQNKRKGCGNQTYLSPSTIDVKFSSSSKELHR